MAIRFGARETGVSIMIPITFNQQDMGKTVQTTQSPTVLLLSLSEKVS